MEELKAYKLTIKVLGMEKMIILWSFTRNQAIEKFYCNGGKWANYSEVVSCEEVNTEHDIIICT